ncbi:MAG: RidA family protein [Deltaproteobacteria bacterium]|nr:RidA family protein [Deltaproteobacteria bacterium]
MRTGVSTDQAPRAIGPYSQAIRAGGLVFCSGQIPLRADGSLVSGDIVAEAKQVMENLVAVLSEAGASPAHVARSTIYLTDLAHFAQVNDVYGSYFGVPYPARATVQVAALPKGARIEIDAVAVVGQ